MKIGDRVRVITDFAYKEEGVVINISDDGYATIEFEANTQFAWTREYEESALENRATTNG